ncbi:MAG: PAS domain-containing protein, partial [Novibacillus thermophilus]
MTLNMSEQTIYYLKALLETSRDAIAVINREGEVLFWNKGAERTYNIRHDEIVGKKIKHFFREEDLKVLQMLETEQPVRDVYHRPRPEKN